MDFKRDAEAVKPEDLVAFANGGGGVIFVGVDEVADAHGRQRGNVVGCAATDRERNKTVSRANSCRPPIPVNVTVEQQGKQTIMRVDIPKGGLHCTSNGTYKARRDGQTDIIEPTAMAKIIVELERNRILFYLRSAVRPELELSQMEMQEQYEAAQAEIEDLCAELDDAHGQFDREEW